MAAAAILDFENSMFGLELAPNELRSWALYGFTRFLFLPRRKVRVSKNV